MLGGVDGRTSKALRAAASCLLGYVQHLRTIEAWNLPAAS